MPPTISAGPLTLLHIDDSIYDRLLLKLAARLANKPLALYNAASAHSAQPHFAPRAAHSDTSAHPHPALVLLDYDMGDHTGADFLSWLRLVRKADLPVVMFTGSQDEAIVRECYSAGADHFLTKPDSVDRAIEIVSTLYHCLSSDPPEFAPLAALPEYRPNPMTLERR
jgi:DNA-binding NarL/FixJ family response regulator